MKKIFSIILVFAFLTPSVFCQSDSIVTAVNQILVPNTALKAVALKPLFTKLNNRIKANEAETLNKYNNVQLNFALKSELGFASNSVFYVDRRWTGARGGVSWTAQNTLAKRGSISYAFPDVWAARDAAVAALKAGTLTKTTIHVFGGNSFSFSNVVGNGSDYESATFEPKRYDTYNSDSTSTNTVSLLYENLDYYFENNTTLVHNGQNGTTIPFADGGTSINSTVSGYLTYKANYGQGQGKSTSSIILTGLNSKISLTLSKWDSKAGWLENIVTCKEYLLKVNVMYRVTGTIHRASNSRGVNHRIEIGTLLQGKYAGSDYAVSDCWPLFTLGNAIGYGNPMSNSSVTINIHQASIEDDCDGIFFIQRIDTSNIAINIDILTQSARSGSVTSSNAIFNCIGSIWTNSSVLLHLGIVKSDMGILKMGSGVVNSHINIDCYDCDYNNSSSQTKAAFNMQQVSDTLSTFVIGGNYRSSINPIVNIASTTNKMLLNGAYSTTSTNPVIILAASAPQTLLNAALYSSGANSISAAAANSLITIMPSATANVAPTANVVTQGATLNINSLFRL